MKNETAMMELIDYCIRQIALYKDEAPNVAQSFLYAKSKAEILLEKEKKQIADAYDAGLRTQHGIQTSDFKCGEKYFEEDFIK